MFKIDINTKKLIKKLLVCLVILIIVGIYFTQIKKGNPLYVLKKKPYEWTIDQAFKKGQVKIDFRRGTPQFEILPFKAGSTNDFEVYFKNEGPNDVHITFSYFDDNRSDINGMTIKPNEEGTLSCETSKLDPKRKVWLAIADASEPNPIIYGELLIH